MNSVGWFEIYVQDMDRARSFYAEVLQVQLEDLLAPEGHDIHMVSFPMHPDKPGAAGALVKMEGVASGGSGTLVYFTCEDCKDLENRVEAAGGKIFKPKESIGEYGFISLAFDPDGNMIGFHSNK